MQHWNSFSTLYTPFQSYFLPVNHILLVRVGKTGQYWWVIVYNSLRTHDLHQYKSFFILCFLKLNPYRRVPFKRSLMEVSKEVNMWNPGLFRRGCKQTRTLRWQRGKWVQEVSLGFYRFKLQLGRNVLLYRDRGAEEHVKWPKPQENLTLREPLSHCLEIMQWRDEENHT